MSPARFSEFVTPCLAELTRGYRDLGYYVIKHTDGNLMPILDQLVQTGPHALHSLDPQGGVDIAEVKRRYGRQLCLIGNVHCGMLDTGAPEQIREAASYALRHGGLPQPVKLTGGIGAGVEQMGLQGINSCRLWDFVPYSRKIRVRPWLASPLVTEVGTLQLAGALEDGVGLDPAAMRVLGSYALIYILAADGYYADANGVRRDLRGGDVVLITPELAHAYGPKPGTRWRHLYAVFSGPQFDLWRRQGLLDPGRPVWRAEPVDFWARRLEEAVLPDEGHGHAAALRTLGRFLEVLAALAALRDADEHDAQEVAWLDESRRLLGGVEARGWLAPQDVAREVGLNYENFRKQFTVRIGMSPGRFQMRKRIERAQAAIYHGDRTLKQLAEELEFCDVFHFSKAFKQVAGVSPSTFRRKVRGG